MIEEYIFPDSERLKTRELTKFFGKCWYDADFGVIVYESAEDAERAYLTLQSEEAEKYIKAATGIEDVSRLDNHGAFNLFNAWAKGYADRFAKLWRRNNAMVKVEREPVLSKCG
jgi:hypothetical protein